MNTKNRNNNIYGNIKGIAAGGKNMNHKKLLIDSSKRMLNRNQFVQNTKITINPIFGVPDNYSFN